MAFADPQVVKVDGTNNVNLPRVSTGEFSSEYLSSDGTITLRLSTANGRRKRHVCRLDLSKITTDPFDTSQNVEVGTSVYLVIDKPLAGFNATEMLNLVNGLTAYLTASSSANVVKLLGSES